MYINTGAPPLPAVAGTDWLDILSPTSNIEIDRHELELGVLHADIHDADLDPKTNSQMHKGAAVRCQAQNAEGTWVNLFHGHVTDISITYSHEGRPHISLNALDAVAELANRLEDDGVATLAHAGSLVARQNLPVSYNGTPLDLGVGAYTTTYLNPEQGLLDVVRVARDTEKGFAWVDRTGVLQLYTAGNLPDRGGEVAFTDVFDPNAPTRTNLATNPNRVGGGTAWPVVVGTYTPSRATTDTSANSTFSQAYTFGVTLKGLASLGAQTVNISVGYLSGNRSNVTTYNNVATYTVSAGQTVRAYFNFLPSANGANTYGANYEFAPTINVGTLSGGGSATLGTHMDFDKAIIETGNVATERTYFDGGSVGASHGPARLTLPPPRWTPHAMSHTPAHRQDSPPPT